MGVVGALVHHPRRALRTVNLLRAKVLRAIQGAQPAAEMALIGCEVITVTQLLEDPPEGRRQLLGRDRVQQVANLRITGYLIEAEQARRIVLTLAALRVPLVGQKRGRLHKDTAKAPKAASASS